MFTESAATADGYDYEIFWEFDPSRPWLDFFEFVWRMDCDTDGLDFILLGSGEYKSRCIVRDSDGWFYTVKVVVEYGFAAYDDFCDCCDPVWYVVRG